MFTQLELMLAFRYLRAKRSEGFISVIAGFSLLGIILGVATLIIVMSVMNGFRAELIGRILGLNGNFGVYHQTGFLPEFDKHSVTFAEIPGVKAVTPQIEGQGLVVGNSISRGVVVRGIRWTDLSARKQLWDSLINKDIDQYDFNGIILGNRLAKQLGVRINDYISLLSPQMTVTAFGSVPKQKRFKVIELFDVGMFEYDNSFAFINLQVAQELFGHKINNTVSNLEIYISKNSSFKKIYNRIKSISPDHFVITDWKVRNASFINALNVERNVMFIILTLIIMVAAFNIISSMIMLVRSKTSDIAVLAAMGASSSNIMKIFFVTGASIGIIGTTIGTVLGLLTCYNIDSIRRFLEKNV